MRCFWCRNHPTFLLGRPCIARTLFIAKRRCGFIVPALVRAFFDLLWTDIDPLASIMLRLKKAPQLSLSLMPGDGRNMTLRPEASPTRRAPPSLDEDLHGWAEHDDGRCCIGSPIFDEAGVGLKHGPTAAYLTAT